MAFLPTVAFGVEHRHSGYPDMLQCIPNRLELVRLYYRHQHLHGTAFTIENS
jgi:hypothetical protein